jgi:hypothetical protein
MVSPMDPVERLATIQELQEQIDAGRERIEERRRQREEDPIAFDDCLRAERQAEAERVAYVQRKVDAEGLLYRTTWNEPAPAARADAGPLDADGAALDENARNQKGWDDWIAAHLRNERGELLDMITEAVAEFTSEYVSKKLQPLRTEIADLKRALAEREERAAAISEVKKQYAGERVEREALQLSSALGVRDARIERLEMQVKMLCGFLSVGGYTLPKDL